MNFEKRKVVLSCARRAQQKTLKTISTQINIYQNNRNFLNFKIHIFENVCSKNISKFKKGRLFWKFAFAAQYWAHLILPSTSFLFLKKQNGGAEIFSKTIQNLGFWFTARSCMPLGLPSTNFVFLKIWKCGAGSKIVFWNLWPKFVFFQKIFCSIIEH